MANNSLVRIPVGQPAPWLLAAAEAVGLDYAPLSHEITDEFKVHVLRRHGDLAHNGRATITEGDFSRISGIAADPDMAVIGATRDGKVCNAYAKYEENATYLYFDIPLTGRHNKVLRGKTFYRINREITLAEFLRTVTMNEETDITNGKILEKE